MTSDPGLALRLLPEVPGWTAGPAGLTRSEVVDFVHRAYHKGHARASVEVTAGEAAAAVVAQAMNIPLEDYTPGKVGSRVWVLRGRRAHLVQTAGGGAYSLGVILRGGPGDLRGSVRLEIKGARLRPDDAVGLALALDWDAITAALAGALPPDPARVAAAARPPPAMAPSPRAPILWPMLPSLRSMEEVGRLERRRPPRFEIANRDEVLAVLCPAMECLPERVSDEEDALRFAAMPTPVLRLDQRGFAPDLLWSGLHFASARLRNALGLGPEAIEYREVDASGSAAAAREADYKVFRVVRQADPVDLARMYGHEPDRDRDGSPTLAWMLSVGGPHAAPRRTVWREGFVAPAPLFRDRTGRLIATEALAERLTRAGVEDVVFQDVTSEASLHGLAFRPGAARAEGRP